MFSGPTGSACVEAAFPADALTGLSQALAAVSQAYPSGPVQALIGSLNPRRSLSSRAVISKLGKQGPAQLCAGPALAGWVKLSVARGGGNDQRKWAIHEAMYRLTEMRALLGKGDLLAPQEACERVRRFFDEVFQPYLLTLLVPPVRHWHRGLVDYLAGMHGDLEATAAALQQFLVVLREETWSSTGEDDWDEYTHQDVINVIGDLGPRLAQLRLDFDDHTDQPPH